MKFLNQMIITWILTKIAVRDWREQKILNQDVTILFCFCLIQLLFCTGQIKVSTVLFHMLSGACSASGLLLLITILIPGAFGGGRHQTNGSSGKRAGGL